MHNFEYKGDNFILVKITLLRIKNKTSDSSFLLAFHITCAQCYP